jgi:uncharacterized membrane protein YidH (DUF202 family)
MGEMNPGDEIITEKPERKIGRGKKKETKAHRFYKNRVWTFIILAILFPVFGFGFWALAYTKQFEKHSDSKMIPILLIISYVSMVVFCIFWLVIAAFIFITVLGILAI